MKSQRQFLLPVTLSLLLLAAAGPVWAQSRPTEDQRPPRGESSRSDGELRAPAKTRRASLSDAVRRVQRETGGQVLGAERVQFDGRDINRIKVIDDRGRVRYLDDDPQQGRGQRREVPRARGDNPSTP